MIDPHIREELLVALDNLPEEAQRRVAEYARTLTARQSPGFATNALLRLAGSIEALDLKQMDEAIQEGCEKVDVDGW
ncbi:MAG: hypothetical protein ABSG54_10835 [Terriglobia bacterium]|jgi:hypothetical protein